MDEAISDVIELIIPEVYEVKPIIITPAFISATIAAASILAVITEPLETGVDNRVSRVLSIFSFDMEAIRDCDVSIMSTITMSGSIIFCIITFDTTAPTLTFADLSATTVCSVTVRGSSIVLS